MKREKSDKKGELQLSRGLGRDKPAPVTLIPVIQSSPLAGGTAGKLTLKLYETLTGIQYGRLPDTHGWVEFI